MPKKVQLTELGKFLRKFRAVNNMTAEELARELGISSTLLYKLETGQRNATFDFYYRFNLNFANNKVEYEFDQGEFERAAGKATERVEIEPINADAATEWLKIANKLKYASSFDLAKVSNYIDALY